MRYFQQIAAGVNVMPLVHALQRNPGLWNAENIRTTYPNSPHHEADDILLRFNEIPKDNAVSVINDKDCFDYPAFALLPQARPLVFDLMRAVEGEQLGRLLITRLAPGKKIYPHMDQGAPAEFYDRYHIMLQNGPGSVFECGDEKVVMRAGDVWWFDNTKIHSVTNNSADDRITMIVDIKTC